MLVKTILFYKHFKNDISTFDFKKPIKQLDNLEKMWLAKFWYKRSICLMLYAFNAKYAAAK